MIRAAILLAAIVCAAPAAAQDTHVAVIVGLAGDPEHGEAFQRWAKTLAEHATGRLGIPRERVISLTEKTTKAAAEQALSAMASRAKEDDPVFIFLIGHGTFDGKVAKFNLTGPDMTPADFAAALNGFKSRKVVFVNTTSASAPFVEALAGPGRTIVSATRSGAEKFSTLFGGFFIDALASDTADADKNKRISVLEAFNAAKAEVKRAYEKQGIMVTEHAVLDDGGDGEGSLDPSPDGKDGRTAAILSMGAPASALVLPDDPKLRQLYQERRDLESRIESLKLLKGSMDAAKYTSELEKLLTDLALKTRDIRAIEGKK